MNNVIVNNISLNVNKLEMSAIALRIALVYF